jgi:hypothetical protein
VFDERQIQELTVDLKWVGGAGVLNQDNSTTPGASTNALGQSKCSVTISDPYLTGIAWPVLYDAASIFTASNIAAANNIILPACTDEQDPIADKCFKYVDLETDSTLTYGGDFAFLLISLWYEVAGTSFGTDFYFRVEGFSVAHGVDYPRVTISGVEARSILFNQSLVNMTFDEGAEIEKVLKDIAEKSGYSVSFCLNTNNEPQKKRLLPRSIRFKGVTPDEAIKKILDSVGGTSTSLPLREYANKITMCARGELSNRTCSVFYLGKGLYEGYDISGQPQLSALTLNAESGSAFNNGDPYRSEAFNSQSYVIQDITPERRKKALEKVKKVAFPKLFDPVTPHLKGALRVTSGFAWKDSKPAQGLTGGRVAVINERVKDTLLFGIAPNGTTAISFLNGDVKEADGTNGRVVINTKFGLRVCKPDDDKKCFHRQIKQESTGLSSVKVKINDKVEVSQEIGASTAERPEYTRFFIEGFGGEQVTLNPQLVWDWAIPEEQLKDANPTSAPVSGNPQQATPPSPTSSPGFSGFVGRVGSTGKSTGPHVHIQESTSSTLSEQQLRDLAGKYVKVGGKSLTSFTQGDGFGAGRGHKGLDYPIKEGEPITVVGQIVAAGPGVGRGDCGNGVAFKPPEGPELLICHLKDQSIPPNIAGLTSSSGGGKGSSNIQAAPSTQGLTVETVFNGVPRSLRIIPGQTILSFISDYDAWVENGGPRGQDNSRDPGVWIPQRFANWFISNCGYKWREGSLRVSIEGKSAWGTGVVSVPTFGNYLEGMKEAGDIKNTKDYYGYIRSIGDLNWKIKKDDGSFKDSTEELCAEAQYWAEKSGAAAGGSSTNPSATDTQNSFPAANCRTGDPKKDQVINALYSVGINTPNAFAGVLGNFQAESGIQANRHNLANPGTGCSSTSGGPLGSTGYGIAQWCGSRQTNIFNKCGRQSTLSCELSFMVQEIKEGRDVFPINGVTIQQAMNGSKSPSEAADNWNKYFERGPGGIQKRRDFATQIAPQIKCNKPS